MRDDDDGGVVRAADVREEREHLYAGLGIQRAGRLVAQQQRRVLAQRAGDGHALLFAAGKLGGEVVHALAEADLLHDGLGVERILADLPRQLDVFKRREVGHQVVKLEDEADVRSPVIRQLGTAQAGDLLAADGNGAAGGLVHAAQQVQNRGLARTAGAQHHGQLALLHLETDAVGCQHLFAAHLVFFRNVFKGNVAHTGFSFPNDRFAREDHSYKVKSSRMRQRRQ